MSKNKKKTEKENIEEKETVSNETENINYIANLKDKVKENYNITLHEYFTKGKLYYRPGYDKKEVEDRRKRNLVFHSIALTVFIALLVIYGLITKLILHMEFGPGCTGTVLFLIIIECMAVASTTLSKEKMRTRNFFVPFSFKIKKLDNDNIKINKHNNWGLFTIKAFSLAALIGFVVATLFLGQEVEPIYFSLVFVILGIAEISRLALDLITNNDRPFMLFYFKNDSLVEIKNLNELTFFKLDETDEREISSEEEERKRKKLAKKTKSSVKNNIVDEDNKETSTTEAEEKKDAE